MLIGSTLPEDLSAPAYFQGAFTTESLAAHRGRWLVVFFYPLDFTFICPTEIAEFSKRFDAFKEADCEILGVSTDSEHSHKAWSQGSLGEQRFPLVADKAHAWAQAFDVLNAPEGKTVRATFILDPEGIVRWANIHDDSVGRSVSEVLRALSALQTGELCPVDWTPGEKTLGAK